MIPKQLPPDYRELFEERAALREYEGRATREDAEAEALREILELMKHRREKQ